MTLFTHLWNDQAGAVISAELILVATILVLGMITGLTTLRDQVIQELADVAIAVASVNQSFSFSGVSAHHSSTAGSIFQDLLDDCDGPDTGGAEPGCLAICDTPAESEG